MKKQTLLLLCIFLIGYGATCLQAQNSSLKQTTRFEDKVILKLKEKYRPIASANNIDTIIFTEFYDNIIGSNLYKKFPHVQKPTSFVNAYEQRLVDLTLIYEFDFEKKTTIEKVIKKLKMLNLFEYVEPHYIPQLSYTPNDSAIASQYAIGKIKADAAWDVNTNTARGDTNIVIGITDTGIDPNHPEFISQIKYNYADVIDGIDNDGDGYIDNFRGWNFGENNNDPTYRSNAHGLHVSGIAAAATDNGIGIAGVGFNCKFLPINIMDTSGVITAGYEGIVYAADHGCDIINCSWGGAGRGQLGQDVISYATINKNALVVAAAGNNGSEIDFFPADYDYVLSVANTNSNDSVSATSNYGYKVDVCAPGEDVLSVYNDSSGYRLLTGTSMSSPCVAGAAAIVKSFYPTYTAMQVGEQLKTTCDNIYSTNDPVYTDKLGEGRINLFRALTQNTSPSIIMTARLETDNKGNLFYENDTIFISGTYTNYLLPAANVIATLSSTSEYVKVVDSVVSLGAISTLGTTNNTSNPYKIVVLPNTPLQESIVFKLTYIDVATAYSHTEYFTIIVNFPYVHIDINDVALTIADNGRIGYYDTDQQNGLGFTYKNYGSLIYEAGLMVGLNSANVSDGIRATGIVTDNDFRSVKIARKVTPTVHSEMDMETAFNDNNAYSPLPISVQQSAYAWTTSGNRKYIILKYIITNTGNIQLVNMYAGIFADWDITAATFDENRIAFDAENKLAYVFHTGNNGIYGGIQLLSNSAPVVHYAVDHVVGGSGGLDLDDNGFSSAEKHLGLSTNRNSAGVGGNGNDVIDILSSGPFILNPGVSVEVGFALIAGNNLADLQKSAQNAQSKYDEISNISADADNRLFVYPNPTSGNVRIDFYVSEAINIEIKVLNILGEPVGKVASGMVQMGLHSIEHEIGYLKSGCYFYQLIVGGERYMRKIIVTD